MKALNTFRNAFSWSLAPGTAWGAIGVFASGVLLGEVNLLSARHYVRYDASSEGLYSLKDPTRALLESISAPVTVTVLLEQAHPLLSDVRQTLASYLSVSHKITVRYLDPERDPAEFLAFMKKVSLAAESPNDTATVALVVESQERTWLIPASKLSRPDDEGRRILTIEPELTEAIAQTQQKDRQKSCFITGHGELSIDDAAPTGLLDLGKRLRQSNIDAVRVPFDVPSPELALKDCDAVVVVGPERPWPKAHADLLHKKIKGGTPALLLLDPIVGDQGRIESPGLGEVLQTLGVVLEPSFLLEGDPTRRLPTGVGEVFFPEPTNHPITQGLSTASDRVDSKVLLSGVQPLRQFAGSPAQALLKTSAKARVICDLNHPETPSCPGAKPGEKTEPFTVALASELPSKTAARPLRAVVVGTASLAQNRTFNDPSAFGSRVFLENAFSWVMNRPRLVSLPESNVGQGGVRLTEESLSSLFNYVIIYLPLFVALLGGTVLLRRHRREELSREEDA